MRDTMTERFENLFARLAQRREGAFVPFVNLCDPDPETSLAVLETLVASGADHASGTPAERIIRDLERAKAPPTLLGFGISTPGHVRRALEAGAAGVIVGSALVKIVSEHLGDRDAMLKALGSAAASFKAATRTA